MGILSFFELCADEIAVVLWAVDSGKLVFWRLNLALWHFLPSQATSNPRRVHLFKLDVKDLIWRTLHIQCWLDHGADRLAHIGEELPSFASLPSCCGVLEARVGLADLRISLRDLVQLSQVQERGLAVVWTEAYLISHKFDARVAALAMWHVG